MVGTTVAGKTWSIVVFVAAVKKLIRTFGCLYIDLLDWLHEHLFQWAFLSTSFLR